MKILIVEDDANLCDGLTRTLRRAKWDVDSVTNASAALDKITEIDLMLTDVRMPGMDGLQLLREARKKRPDMEVIIMTGYGSIPSAVEAMKNGARAYLTKPFDTEELLIHLREVNDILSLKQVARKAGRGELVGSSTVMREVYHEIDVASASEAPVLITGETGTGKDLAAHAIHSLSSRKAYPMITINLGALPRDLVEGELFGHEKGAFTSANTKKLGRFVLADEGVLFLDEIDSLPIALQPKFLRAIEKKEIWPLGSEKHEQINVRIISASNANLEDLIEKDSFRKDLYYRLNVLRIHMPALREHPEDIPQITRTLLDRIAAQLNIQNIEITAECLSKLITQEWPGNTRELSNALERAVAQTAAAIGQNKESAKNVITINSLPSNIRHEASTKDHLPFKEAKERAANDWAIKAIRIALSQSNGNVSEAARHLQMSRTALIRLINKYNLRTNDGTTEDMPGDTGVSCG
ncbi:sigma-54-dependent transcriptional regulator [Verrucomicrobiota bacterium]